MKQMRNLSNYLVISLIIFHFASPAKSLQYRNYQAFDYYEALENIQTSVISDEIFEQINFLAINDDVIGENEPLEENAKNIKEDYERWSIEEFLIAGERRYTLTGELPYKESHIKPLNFALFTGTYVTFMVAQHYLQMKTIWQEQGKFHILEDGPYAMYSDKAGHFFGCYFTSYMMTEGFLQAGLSWDASTFWGAMMGLSYSTYVEILDGHAKDWGFSPSDFYANFAGFSMYLGQHYFPFLQNFTPKFQYVPARWHGEKSREPAYFFIDDYSSHTLWMSVNVYNLLPEQMQPYWPSWLELAFGYAVRGLCDKATREQGLCEPRKSDKWVDDYYFGSPRYVIALDYNLIRLLPDGGNLWNWFRQTLNYIKLPSPAIEFGPNTKFYIVYPFHLQLKL